MFNRNKIQTVGTISEFMNPEVKIKKAEKEINRNLASVGLKVAVAVTAGTLTLDFVTPSLAFASQEAIPVFAGEEKLRESITKAFDPLLDVIIELSRPIAGIMITGGALSYMIGLRDKGISLIQNASIGYLLVQISPMLLRLLVGVGGTVA